MCLANSTVPGQCVDPSIGLGGRVLLQDGRVMVTKGTTVLIPHSRCTKATNRRVAALISDTQHSKLKAASSKAEAHDLCSDVHPSLVLFHLSGSTCCSR